MLFIVTVYYLSHLPCRIPVMFYEELQRDNIYLKRPLWFRLVTEFQITNQENHVYISYLQKYSVFGKIFMVVLWFFIFHALLHYLLDSSEVHFLGYTGCHRRNGPNFGRVFLVLNYTDITQNTYIQSRTVTEIMAREKCGHLAFPHNVRLQLCSALTVRLWRHKLRPTR